MDPERVRELEEKVAGGDADALGTLLGHFGPRVEAALRIGRRWQAAIDPVDVMQVTYLEAFMQMRRFDPARGGRFERWLRTIAANNLRDAVRGLAAGNRPPPERRLPERSPDESASEFIGLLGYTTTTPSREAGRGEASRILQAAIGQLPPAYREVVRLYDLEGRTIAEVVSAVGRSAGAVHMLRARAHARLRELLGDAADLAPSRA
jgi:RNA polymerase sigma-70 factor (subfamily 1)